MKESCVSAGPYVVEIEGVLNTRNIAGFVTENGKVVKPDLLYRSAEMDSPVFSRITQKGIDTALNKLKIKTDLDLRKTAEQVPFESYEDQTGPLGKGVKYINYQAKEYCDFLKGESNEADIMRVFADINNYPIIFHCVWGADRTGTVAYLLEMLIGVKEEDRFKDYEITGSRDRNHTGFKLMCETIENDIEGKTQQEKAHTIFSKNFGLTEMEISNVKNILLTDGAVFSSASLKEPIPAEKDAYKFQLVMRNSQTVKSVCYNCESIEFSLNDGALVIYGIKPKKDAIGTILFDDGSELRFAF